MLESNKSHNNKTNTLFQLQITTWRSKVMNPVSSMPWSFFLLLLFFNGILATVIPNGAEKNIETVYDSQRRDDDHLCLNHAHDDDHDDDGHGCHKHIHSHMHAHVSSSNSHDHQMDPSLNVFFHFDDVKMGKKIPLYFPIKDPSKIPQMIPKKEANSIPFSKTHLNQILDFFEFSQDSSQAKAIEETLNHCELPPIKGETKFCATSLESMLDKLTQIFGFGNKFKVLTTTQMRNWTPQLQNYTILKDAHEIYVNKMVGCHPMPYPYAVFYCHMQKGDTKLFELSLEGEKDGVRVDALGICHMDTSEWDPRHASFRVLGVKPGSEPVCHVFPQDNLVWVSSPSYVN